MFDRPTSATANDLRAELEDPFAAPRTTLHLHGGGGVAGVRDLDEALRRSPGLEELWIEGRVLGGDFPGDALAGALGHTPRLRKLRLAAVGEPRGFGELARRLGALPLDCLEIHGTPLRQADLEALASLLREGGPPCLRMAFVPVRGAAAVALARAAVGRPRDLLEFIRCDLAPEAVRALATTASPVRRLLLELNPLRRNDVRLLLAAHPHSGVNIAYARLDEAEIEMIRRDVLRARETCAAL